PAGRLGEAMQLRWFQVDGRVVAMAHFSALELKAMGVDIGSDGPTPEQVERLLRGMVMAEGETEPLPPLKGLVGYHLEPLAGGILVALQAEVRAPRRRAPRHLLYQFSSLEWMVEAARHLDRVEGLQVTLYVLPQGVDRRWCLRVRGSAAALRRARVALEEFGVASPFRLRELNRLAETIIPDGMPILRTQFSRP
ncbi:MAG: hypothetical protein DIU70_009000, partial [Bacillota bacterium]